MIKRLLTICFILLFAASAFAGSQQTSSTTAATIIINARYYLNEDSNAAHRFFSDTELLRWVNDGMRDIAARSHCTEATESVTLATDIIEYTIATEYITTKSVTYTDAAGTIKGLLEGNVRSIGSEEDVGEPVYWYEFAGKVGIYPALASRTTEVATAYLITRPVDVISSAAVTTPAMYDTALALYVVAQGFLKDMRFDAHARVMALYQAEIDRYRGDFNEFAREKAEEPIR